MKIVSNKVSVPDRMKVERALISVFDKTGIVELAKELTEYGVEIISTGGSAKIIGDASMDVTDVSSLTGFTEIMGGRVKTLHPGIHGGLLAVRGDENHVKAMQENNILGIDLLISNLYPFEKTIREGANYTDCVENIDIGGPAMIRAGAKNHAYVAVVIDPADYGELLQEMRKNGGATNLQFRKNLAAKAYGSTACYDAAIANWFTDTLEIETPTYQVIGGKLALAMRYGENPHQKAALYVRNDQTPSVVGARQLQGKSLSYNNINDADAAFELISEFNPEESCAVAIIKHANPCGVAQGSSLTEAYEKALACDPISAFGGIVALNRTIDADVAEKIIKTFTEVIIAPNASKEAKAIIASKKNLRLLLSGSLADSSVTGISIKTVRGGILAQSRDDSEVRNSTLKIVTKREPSENEMKDMKFAFLVAKHVKSNAIVYAKNGATVGIGAGQMSRIDSTRIAIRKAQEAAQAAGLDQPLTQGSVLASDAFFPFVDGILIAIEAGATAIIQPGGSIRDGEVIAAADKAGITMMFTGIRHFRH